MADLTQIELPDGNTYDLKDANATDTKVTQTQDDSTNSFYEVLIAGSTSNTTATEGTRKSSKFKYHPNQGAITIGERSSNHTIGEYSSAQGWGITAEGRYAHAEGGATRAEGDYSHAEGRNSVATGSSSHAEGSTSLASGESSHAEGSNSLASGIYSHSQGLYTIANHKSQYVFGEYNIEDSSEEDADSRGNYVEIVGNGKNNMAETFTTGNTQYTKTEINCGYKPSYVRVSINGYVATYDASVSTTTSKMMDPLGFQTTITLGETEGATGISDITNTGFKFRVNESTFFETSAYWRTNTRSNARTLDWDGNEVLAGKLTLGAAPTANMDATTKLYVDTGLSGKVDKAGGTMTGALNMNGGSADINLKTSGPSSDDSSDIVWYYGNGQEKARLWTANSYTSAEGINYRVYKSDGTSLYSGTLSPGNHTHDTINGTYSGSGGQKPPNYYGRNNYNFIKLL